MSTHIGRTAEDVATTYLESLGWTIIARNWRTRRSELDIIARHGNVIHIVEVKYRRNAAFGTGFDYITPDKVRRLRAAATMWATMERYRGSLSIDVISIMGDLDEPTIELLENVIEG